MQATFVYVLMQGRLAEADMPMAAAVCLAMYAFARGASGPRGLADATSPAAPRRRVGFRSLFYLGTGLSFLLKGVGPVFVLAGCGAFLTLSLIQGRDWRPVRALPAEPPRPAPAGRAALLLAAGRLACRPGHRAGLAPGNRGPVRRGDGREQAWYFYGGVVPVLLMPWLPFALGGVFEGVKPRRLPRAGGAVPVVLVRAGAADPLGQCVEAPPLHDPHAARGHAAGGGGHGPVAAADPRRRRDTDTSPQKPPGPARRAAVGGRLRRRGAGRLALRQDGRGAARPHGRRARGRRSGDGLRRRKGAARAAHAPACSRRPGRSRWRSGLLVIPQFEEYRYSADFARRASAVVPPGAPIYLVSVGDDHAEYHAAYYLRLPVVRVDGKEEVTPWLASAPPGDLFAVCTASLSPRPRTPSASRASRVGPGPAPPPVRDVKPTARFSCGSAGRSRLTTDPTALGRSD